ncbi:MAG: filamentous hemagglutinin N-terminal domain-containing protein, partial [Gloeotrichia echinulata HAB0833]
MSNFWVWFKSLGIAIGSAIAFCGNSAIAQITQDGTLPTNSQVTPQGNIINIEGGTQVGSNLFHSFKEFSVPAGSTANFKNTENIQNIISRVTGKSISDIQGIIKAGGTANLFLINPNGIVFGPNASLQIGGSFLATTASSLNFADGTKFSATDPQTTPLLTVSVPIGLQFGATAAPIRNQSQAPSPDGKTTNVFGKPIGLQVEPGKTLALVGGDITLEGGNLTAPSGRIQLGSVAGNSLVTLNPNNQGWVLGYEKVQDFQNIQLIRRRTDDGSQVPSQVDASNNMGSGGNIQVLARTVLLSGDGVSLINQTTGDRDGEDITITTRKLIVQDGAQVSTSTLGKGAAGTLSVNASESVELIGSVTLPTITGFITLTADQGKAGNIKIDTRRLLIQNGARVIADSSGIIVPNSLVIPATGPAGNITINALDSVEITGKSIADKPSVLTAQTFNFPNGGIVNITTGQVIVKDEAQITVSVRVPKNQINLEYPSNPGTPGTLNITARSILLDNKGQLTSTTRSGQGGNINLQVQDFLRMR